MAAVTLAALSLAAIGWFALSVLTPAEVAAPTPGPVIPTTTATGASSGAPATSETVTGGDIGRPVSLRTDQGVAEVVLESATWTTEGELAPRPGLAYLVVDLAFTGTAGEVPVGSIFVDAEDATGAHHLMVFGPPVDEPLATRLLTEGVRHRGQVGFELPRGPVTVRVLDAALRPVATIAVPER